MKRKLKRQSGEFKLNSGGQQLYSGSQQLNSGGQQLNSGGQQFHQCQQNEQPILPQTIKHKNKDHDIPVLCRKIHYEEFS